MKINHTLPSLSMRDGGPSRSVPQLCNELVKYINIEISTIKSIDEIHLRGLYPVHKFKPTNRILPIGSSHDLRNYLEKTSVDIYSAHGLWSMSSHYAVKAALKNKKPIIISPRGMLEPEALKFSRWKKILAGVFWQNKDLNMADCIHVTSKMELDNCRLYGLKNPIAYVPNGLNIHEYPLKGSATGFSKIPIKKKRRTLLFLSRIHEKKGLENLIKSWSKLTDFHPSWKLIIAGNDENDYEVFLKKIATSLGINWSSDRNNLSASLFFVGPVYDQDKINEYHNADLFILPSMSENFGMVIAEAMSCGLPVITTKQTPWRSIELANAGWWINPEERHLTESLTSALSLSKATLQSMGINGHKLIKDNYSIESIAKKMIRVYEWCINKKNPPNYIHFYNE